MNTAAVQRILFCMQIDPEFCQAVLSRKAEELEGLGERELAIITGLDAAAISADHEERRFRQIYGNLIGEFELSYATLPPELEKVGHPASFFRTAEFRRCVLEGGSLPLAFADFWEAAALDAGRRLHRAIVILEAEMCRTRRLEFDRPAPEGDQVALHPACRMVELPAGTLRCAVSLRSSGSLAEGVKLTKGHEVILLSRGDSRSAWSLPGVDTEVVHGAVAILLGKLTGGPMSAAERAEFARQADAEPSELESLIEGLCDDGILITAR